MNKSEIKSEKMKRAKTLNAACPIYNSKTGKNMQMLIVVSPTGVVGILVILRMRSHVHQAAGVVIRSSVCTRVHKTSHWNLQAPAGLKTKPKQIVTKIVNRSNHGRLGSPS